MRIRVPVKLSYPKKSDATESSNFQLTITGGKLENGLIVNGETIEDVWCVNADHSVILKGTAPNLIKALDAGFYASTWKKAPAAMTVSKINVWIGGNKIADNEDLYNVLVSEVKDDVGLGVFIGLHYMAVSAVLYTISDGIKRDKESDFDFLYLTQFIAPITITFRGLVDNGASNASDHILVLDESPIYKELGSAAVDNLLQEKFTYNGVVPSFDGLKDIVNGNDNTDKALNTSYAIYNSLKSVFASQGTKEKPGWLTKKVSVQGYDLLEVDIYMPNVFDAMCPAEKDTNAKKNSALNTLLRNLEIEMTIVPCPHLPESAYGNKNSSVSVSALRAREDAKNNPIIFWGIDAYGPDKSSPTN